MSIAIAVGTRPEIVKMAPIIRACQADGVPFSIIHTGQHYSYELDGIFFEELRLPEPDVRLEVGSGSHAYQISTIIARLEPLLIGSRPDMVLVQGDTNSVVGVGLTARSLRIPVGHVEAGLRSYDRSMPEEMNRVLVDHLAERAYAPTGHSASILLGEGIPDDRILVTGNTVVDELEFQRDRAEGLGIPALMGLGDRRYAVATVHRPENTDDPERLRGILDGVGRVARDLRLPIVMALHPRTQQRITDLEISLEPSITVLPPLGYLEFLGLQAGAALVLTDSGGLQEEACVLRVPCVTMRSSTERPESIHVGANVLADADPLRIVAMAERMLAQPRTWPNPFGDGLAGARIVASITGREVLPPAFPVQLATA